MYKELRYDKGWSSLRQIKNKIIATISISLSEKITRRVRPPRALCPGFPLGHPIAFPGQTFWQLQVLRLLLKYLEELNSPGTIVKIDMTKSDDLVTSCSACVPG